MLIGKPNDIRFSEVTPKDVYLNRRNFLIGAAAASATVAAAGPVSRWLSPPIVSAQGQGKKLQVASKSLFSAKDELTPYKAVTTYNNYYEFGSAKEQPVRLARNFRTSP
jgi:sulfoxide reductase catalytic subunit YedY